ncbi:MAG TPA: hypothetical protein VFY10_06805 [Dehalococcoidia bacterium]|nr:hypothetical protein [Dehalococcoidia bacterium]
MKPPTERARRCSICGISWPAEFDKCYECGGATDLFKGEPTITVEEAESKKRHYEFDKYLEETGRA